MKFEIRKAERKKAKLRAALIGVSGSGKTYSSLLLAKGIGGKICVIDTENNSADLYANEFDYDVLELGAPFEPLKYVEAIKYAESSGYEVIIIDSLSHAWSGEGGFLDLTDRFAKSSNSKNTYTAFKETTPMQNKMVNAILQSNSHIIATMRSKTHYDLQDDGKGRKVPVKIGLAPIQREGMEYEFTILMEIQQNHYCMATKDRTGIFTDPFIPSVESGEKIRDWLNMGKDQEVEDKMRISEIAFQYASEIDDIDDIQYLRDSFLNVKKTLLPFMKYEEAKKSLAEIESLSKEKATKIEKLSHIN